jgi:hypothetical protein
MGSISNGTGIGASVHNGYRGPKRENVQRPGGPEDLVIPVIKKGEPGSEDTVSYLVTTNPFVSSHDTLKPYKDANHRNGLFSSLDEAMQVARQVLHKRERKQSPGHLND